MPSYLQIENLSKSYGPKVLFENIAFNINEGDKIALIAPNGTGKTSLMRILAGKDKSDSGGQVKFLKDIRIAFLEQDYPFDPDRTVGEEVFTGNYDQELTAKKILDNFSLSPEMRMGDLSGGEVKRVALTRMLSSQADFYIMDEPTNHLDTDAIEYLEGYLTKSRCTLFMVTHDRYFLDRVCNTVMEMDHGGIYVYKGDYENYLEKRQERIDNYNAETDKVRNILRRELEWIHATPCARSGKAKYRINAFYDLKDRAEQVYTQGKISMDALSTGSRLGSKIINCSHASFWWGDDCYLKDFTYNFQRGEKVGIVGRNGVGKSTFINLLLNAPDVQGRFSGVIERGESLKVGYYRQEGMHFDEDQTVLETVNDTRLLNRFLFPHDMLSNKISRLSGGEKRRLYLLTILMQEPNLLVLDEPTNDLDIVTLNVLEEYLKEFSGSLIIVSHDRHFLDRLCDHLLVFCGDGVVKDFVGKYTEYRAYIKEYERAQKEAAKAAAPKPSAQQAAPSSAALSKKKKLSFKEQRELEQLEKDLEALNAEKKEIEAALSGGTTDYAEIQRLTDRFSVLKDLLDEKEFRWLELND